MKTQHAEDGENENKAPVDDKQQKFIQQVIGTFLYYNQAVNLTILVALSALAIKQKKPTMATMPKLNQFLNYATTHPDTVIACKKSDMWLVVHINQEYLNECNARSRMEG